jgi:hypothetical protein
MADYLTINAVVDDAVTRSGRVDKRADLAAYANSTVREIQSLGFFFKDLIEDSVLATADPHIWTKPLLLRRLKAVNYGEGINPTLRPPGRQQNGLGLYTPYYFYAADNYFVFKGVTAGTTEINLAYYRHLQRLKYVQAEASRVATFDIETQEWTYLSASTDEEQEAARNLVTNWVIFQYYDCVLEGTLAKLFKAIGEEKRSLSSFALYKSLQREVGANEIVEGLDVTGDGNDIR